MRPSRGELSKSCAGGWATAGLVGALSEGDVVRAMLLFYLAPVWGLLGGWLLLGEQLSVLRVSALLLAMLGIGLTLGVSRDSFAALQPTDWLALSAGLAFALNNLATRAADQVPLLSKSVAQVTKGVVMIGVAFYFNWKLALASLIPAVVLMIFTRFVSPWVRRRNAVSMKSTGTLSAEIQENLNNFKVIVAFNRRDYFRRKFEEVNNENYKNATRAGIANNVFMPVYGFFSNVGQMIVLVMGIYMISAGEFSVGLLISFLAYILQFYNPLRQIAALWANFQVALAGWDRISHILSMESNLKLLPPQPLQLDESLVSFRNVTFGYTPDKEILHNVSFELKAGMTYAFVGPTGGGKTTTASLMDRLYDTSSGQILLYGMDIRSVDPATLAAKIGFILQEPVLFTGTIRDNILYGNECFLPLSDEELIQEMKEVGLDGLLARFEGGLHAEIKPTGESLSLGQKQIIAFIRAVIRRPNLLILDEATANIDTVTEQLLDEILRKLPRTTTKIIIAHRMNTIESADEIFFINSGSITRAGSFKEAVSLLLQGKRES